MEDLFVCVSGPWSSASTCVTAWSSTSSSPPPTRRGEQRTLWGGGGQVRGVRGRDGSLTRVLRPVRLNLRELGPLAAHMRWFVWLMAAAGTVYVFNYHEK